MTTVAASAAASTVSRFRMAGPGRTKHTLTGWAVPILAGCDQDLHEGDSGQRGVYCARGHVQCRGQFRPGAEIPVGRLRLGGAHNSSGNARHSARPSHIATVSARSNPRPGMIATSHQQRDRNRACRMWMSRWEAGGERRAYPSTQRGVNRSTSLGKALGRGGRVSWL